MVRATVTYAAVCDKCSAVGLASSEKAHFDAYMRGCPNVRGDKYYCDRCLPSVVTAAVTTLDALVAAMLRATHKFNQEYIRHWHGVPPCSDEVGFNVLAQFRGHVKKFVFQYNRGPVGLRQAAQELFRLVRVDEATYSGDEAFGFVPWYAALKGRIAKALDKVVDRGDDGFSDLCDAFPLAGAELVKRVLHGEFKTESELSAGLTESEPLQRERAAWHAFIMYGEHYVLSTLEAAARNAFVAISRERQELPYEEVGFADHFSD